MDKFKVRFEIKYVALIFGLIITTAVVAVYLRWADSIPQIKEVMAISAGGLALTGLLYNAMSLHSNLKISGQKLINDQRAFSASLIAEWHTPQMSKLTIRGAKLRMGIKNLKGQEVLEILRNDEDAHSAMVAILNYFEKLAICIENGVADEQLLRDFFGGIIRGYHNASMILIEYKRVELEDQKICIFFQNLAERWAKN
ncbi:MAG TPA: DUF4760 domain-containing protein [Pyrinomonadaceae bacterium]